MWGLCHINHEIRIPEIKQPEKKSCNPYPAGVPFFRGGVFFLRTADLGISDDDRLEIFLAAQADYNDTEMPTLHSSSHHGIRTLSKLSVLLFWGVDYVWE